MDHDAITVDTNIFDEQRLDLEGGVLKQLYRFKQGRRNSSSPRLSSVRAPHLADQAQKATSALSSALTKSIESGILPDATINKTIGTVPAIVAGLTDKALIMADVVHLIDKLKQSALTKKDKECGLFKLRHYFYFVIIFQGLHPSGQKWPTLLAITIPPPQRGEVKTRSTQGIAQRKK